MPLPMTTVAEREKVGPRKSILKSRCTDRSANPLPPDGRASHVLTPRRPGALAGVTPPSHPPTLCVSRLRARVDGRAELRRFRDRRRMMEVSKQQSQCLAWGSISVLDNMPHFLHTDRLYHINRASRKMPLIHTKVRRPSLVRHNNMVEMTGRDIIH